MDRVCRVCEGPMTDVPERFVKCDACRQATKKPKKEPVVEEPIVENHAVEEPKNDILERNNILLNRGDRIPNVGMFPEITVYAEKVGHAKYRYGISPPTRSDPVWAKKMSGVSASQFLRKVKTNNKHGKLESKLLIE